MKKTIITLATIFVINFGFSQKIKSKDTTVKANDTTIVVTLPLNAYKSLLFAIDQNIDSKKNSKEIIDFIIKNAIMKREDENKK